MKTPQLIVRRLRAQSTTGWLEFGPFRWPCAIGRGGIRSIKHEGDGATPRGRFGVLFAYYRPDRVRRLGSALDLVRIEKDSGWCDAPGDANYNRPVRRPYPASTETLWRDDHLYDLIVVLDCNLHPRIMGRGSAIFLHVAREGLAPTEGCVAVRIGDLKRLLSRLPRHAALVVS